MIDRIRYDIYRGYRYFHIFQRTSEINDDVTIFQVNFHASYRNVIFL